MLENKKMKNSLSSLLKAIIGVKKINTLIDRNSMSNSKLTTRTKIFSFIFLVFDKL